MQHEGQPAYIVPPLAHITSGPAGFCFNYGATALPERYKDHFFICDFRGSPGGSSIYSFAVKPKGATFEIADGHQAFGGVLATDCDFGPDGGFYVSDWVDGWGLTGKGRIYRFADADAEKKPLLAETKKLLAEGFDKRSNEELAKLLEHPDMRVRQEAQFALADNGAMGTLSKVALNSKNRLARLHAIWGIGQSNRQRGGALLWISQLLKDADPEIRGQAAAVIIESGRVESAEVKALLADPEPRVRFLALMALQREMKRQHMASGEEKRELLPLILDVIRDNADRDPYLRHAGVMVLATYKSRTLRPTRHDAPPAVRLAALLAMRHFGDYDNDVCLFLSDPEPRIATEAARAIHDVGIERGMAHLAKWLDEPNQPEFLLWRALNANFRLGESENAAAVASFAARPGAPEKLRVEALKMLGEWAKPGRRDRVTGLTQNLGQRDASAAGAAASAIMANLAALFTGPDAVRKEATTAAAKLGIKEVAPVLFDLAADTKQKPATRIEAIRGLATLKDKRLDRATEMALKDSEPSLRNEGRRQLALAKPAQAVPLLAAALAYGSLLERQGAFAILGEMKGFDGDELLSKWMTRLLEKELAPEVHLDLLEAAAKRKLAPAIKDKLAAFEKSRPKDDDLAAWRETLVGGDAERGRLVFLNKSEVTCQKCHKVNGVGGDVGPELSGIGSKQKRDYLLESIVLPNKQIAKGYETVVLQLTSGKSVVGIVKAEDDKEVRLMTFEGQLVAMPKNTIDERRKGKSAMPEDLIKHLSKSELRDLVEFLASLKEK